MTQASISLPTPQLILRPIQEEDLHDIHVGLSDPKVTRYYDVHYDTIQATQEQMQWFAQEQQQWWTIRSRDGATFYGACGFNDIDNIAHKAEIGIWLLPHYWGAGIMREALPHAVQYGFDHLLLQRIEAFVQAENTACQRAMNKLDFTLEKTMPDSELKNGKPIYVHLYTQTKEQSSGIDEVVRPTIVNPIK